MKILFYGCGQMGGAILNGLLSGSVFPKENLAVFDPSELARKKWESAGVRSFADSAEALNWSDTVLIGVKPQIFGVLKEEFAKVVSPKLYLSIMAGVSSVKVSEIVGAEHQVVRTMPNLPLSVGQGATAIVDGALSEPSKKLVRSIFESAGKVISVREDQMDAVTGVAGSGPAWAFEFIEGWIRGGVRVGLSRADAEKLVLQTLRGSLDLLEQNALSPSDWTAAVCSPGGTTIAGLHALEEGALKNTVMNAVFKAAERSAELG